MTYFPDITMKLRYQVFMRQSWSAEQQIAILKHTRLNAAFIEILWRRLTINGELSDYRAGQILQDLIEKSEGKGN